MSTTHSRKTLLTQEEVRTTMMASSVFNREQGATLPLVLTPPKRWCCSCYFHIPSGINTIVEACGADIYPNANAPAGLHCGKCFWITPAYMVTQQACTYNAPVKACPTMDNVMVDVELTLVFQIGPDPIDVKNFVYNLGAIKFNEYLAAECDESMRQLIRQTPLRECYELRGSGSQHVQTVLQTLDQKFREFGVHFLKAAIQDVILNAELRRILQGTTEFRNKIGELEKEHGYRMRIIQYDHQQALSEKERQYDRIFQDLEADIAVLLVNRKQQIVEAESLRAIATTKEEEKADALKKQAEANLSVSVFQAQKANQDLLAVVTADCESTKKIVEAECEAAITESKEMINVAMNNAEALSTEAKAEGDAAEALKVIRKHNLEMAKFEVTEDIAKTAKLVIGGDNGEKLLSSILERTLVNV